MLRQNVPLRPCALWRNARWVLDPIVIVVATAIGALIGTSAGVFLLRRKIRPPVSDAEFAELKHKLQTSESALDVESAKLAELGKQISQQESKVEQSAAEIIKKQRQLDTELAETQKERGFRIAAEQSAQELSAKAALLTEQCVNLEGRVKEEEKLRVETTTQLTLVEAELQAGMRKIEEMTEQGARFALESDEHKRSIEQETRHRTRLEAQLNSDQELIRQLTAQIAELQSERLQLESRLQEERVSAAKGMELLLEAQEKLSSVFKALRTDAQNVHQTQGPTGMTQVNSEGEPVGATAP